jgi:hypothetical protein
MVNPQLVEGFAVRLDAAMGRVKKNKPRSVRSPKTEGRGGGTAVGKERPIVAATRDLVAALETFAAAVATNRDLLEVVALPESLELIARCVANDPMWGDLTNMEYAWEVVDLDLPVAGAAPHSEMRADESHRRWRGPLEPAELLYMAHIAAPDAPGYRTQLRENTAYFEARDRRRREDREVACGRPNKDGSPCGSRPLYAPGLGWHGGLGCWRHVTTAEKASVERAYVQAVADNDCPGCIATAGRPCHVGEDAARYLRLVDGEWARVRSYGDHKVHDARLDLVELR